MESSYMFSGIENVNTLAVSLTLIFADVSHHIWHLLPFSVPTEILHSFYSALDMSETVANRHMYMCHVITRMHDDVITTAMIVMSSCTFGNQHVA